MNDSRTAYDAYHRASSKQNADSPWHNLVKPTLQSPDILTNKTILEVGCGANPFSVWLASQGFGPKEIIAADFSPAAIEMAQKAADSNSVSNIRWHNEDIQDLSFRNEHFDIVFSFETIEHVPKPYTAIKEIYRVLKPGGSLMLTTPNYFGIFGLYRIYLRLRGRKFTEGGQPINNLMLLPLSLLMVKRAGFKIRDFNTTGHYLLRPGRFPKDIKFLNHPRFIMRWFGLHSFIQATKPG